MRKMAKGTEVEMKWFMLMLGIIFIVFALSYLPFILVNQVLETPEIILFLIILIISLIPAIQSHTCTCLPTLSTGPVSW